MCGCGGGLRSPLVFHRVPRATREGPGGFRRSEIEALRPGLTLPTWSDVQPQMDDWLMKVNGPPPDEVHRLEHLADLHASFERIHPFRDGNGRVGRLLINLWLVRGGAPPAIILKRDRPAYLRALGKADAGDSGPLGELFARALRNSIERRVLPALAGPKRLVPLQSLATKNVSRAALLSAAKRNRLRTVKMADELYSTREWVLKYCSSRRQGRALEPAEPAGETQAGEQTSIFG
jgi:Fic family protein